MANLRIVPRNFHDEATLATELAPATGYPIDNTKDTQRSRVWRTTAGTDQYYSGTYADGLSRIASFFGFFRHRCHGGSVRLQLYATAGFTSQVYDSGALPIINVVPTDGLDWGINPYGSGRIDPFLTDAPYWLYFTPTTHLSYRVTFSAHTTLYGYTYWQVCRAFLGRYFEVAYNPDYGLTLGGVSQTDRNRSRGGSLRTNVGPSWRTMTMDFNKYIPESDRAAWVDLMNYCGTGRDFVSSLFPGEATRRERDHTMNVKFSSIDPLVRRTLTWLSKSIKIEEV